MMLLIPLKKTLVVIMQEILNWPETYNTDYDDVIDSLMKILVVTM